MFCKIAGKSEPASVVYEDDNFISFMDIRPVNIGHAIVMPKKHYPDLLSMPEDEVADLFRIVHKIAHKVKETTKADGILIMQSNGKAAGQDIFHIHVHVIPRFKRDKVNDVFITMMKPLITNPSRIELDSVAKKIRSTL